MSDITDDEAAALGRHLAETLRQAVNPEMLAWLQEGVDHVAETLGESPEAWKGALFICGVFGEILRTNDDEPSTSREAIVHAMITLLCDSPGARAALWRQR